MLQEECRGHQFCENSVPHTPRESESDAGPLPKRKVKDQKGNSVSIKLTNRNPLHENEKIVVTNRGLDDWLAKNFGLSIENFPVNKPYNVPVSEENYF